ncbi:YicC/YloC family endoribonuclease [Porcipelethomonas sp.]|uniref:YicC/YloC family endoribonuclease n=1 Tax=Porcipelethomonas sp. TaxID=2981675 RepID=UPI003EF54213
MIRSMTGYGREQQIIDQRDITVEIKSVNHRYYEFSARVPRAYGYLEEKLKSFIKGSISRGKVEVSVSINNINGKEANIRVDRNMAQGYISALREANEILNLEDDLTLSSLIKFSDIFNVQKIADDEEQIWNDVRSVAETALQKFVAMREAEGNSLKEDLLEKLSTVEKILEKVKIAAPLTSENYRERLYAKLKEVLGDTDIDDQRILTETAVFAEKIAIDEETVRLGSHIKQFRELLESNEPLGRKLDFLVQEINREINTIGSKAQDLEITRCVVDMKSEVEKIREQIQNIE